MINVLLIYFLKPDKIQVKMFNQTLNPLSLVNNRKLEQEIYFYLGKPISFFPFKSLQPFLGFLNPSLRFLTNKQTRKTRLNIQTDRQGSWHGLCKYVKSG